MTKALRINDALVADAEIEARLHRRSVPKQIEYWADIGRRVARELQPEDLFALSQGLCHLRLEQADTVRVDSDEVFAAIEVDRHRGTLAGVVTGAAVYYEASTTYPGLIDRVDGDRRTPGRFANGEFVEATTRGE